MEISSPLCITSRLLPGCRIGGAEISIEYLPGCWGKTLDKRQRYHWHIDLSNGSGEFQGSDLYSGAGGGTLQEGLESLLSFLGAFAEDLQSGDTVGARMFPAGLAQWAVENADAIVTMELELQEHPNKLIVE